MSRWEAAEWVAVALVGLALVALAVWFVMEPERFITTW